MYFKIYSRHLSDFVLCKNYTLKRDEAQTINERKIYYLFNKYKNFLMILSFYYDLLSNKAYFTNLLQKIICLLKKECKLSFN